MFDHVSLGVTDFQRSLKFYDAVMKVLGHECSEIGDEQEEFMVYGQDSFFVINTPIDPAEPAKACNGSHVCFAADTPQRVDAFYRECLASGATSAGEPGLRPAYGDGYYACFVYDPDGHKLEAVAYAKAAA